MVLACASDLPRSRLGSARDEGVAAGVLDYENWHGMEFDYGDSGDETITKISIPYGNGEITGEARIESHWPFWMEDGGR